MSSPSNLPPTLSCLSWLIKRVIKGDCDWVKVVKSETKEIMSIIGRGFLKLHWKVRIRCRERTQEWRRKKGRGCLWGWQQWREEKGKREGEDTSAAAWFTECTVTMETFVSPLSSIQSGSPTSGVWGGWRGEGVHGQREGEVGKKRYRWGCWQKNSIL